MLIMRSRPSLGAFSIVGATVRRQRCNLRQLSSQTLRALSVQHDKALKRYSAVSSVLDRQTLSTTPQMLHNAPLQEFCAV